MLRLALVALVATTLIGCVPIRQGNDLEYDFAVFVDRAEAPDQSCAVYIGLHNNLDSDATNFEYGLSFFDNQGRLIASPLAQGDYLPSGGVAKRYYIFPVDCERLTNAQVTHELSLDIEGWWGRRDCYHISKIVISNTVPLPEPAAQAPAVEPPAAQAPAVEPPAVQAPVVEAPPPTMPRFYTLFFDWDKSNITPIAQLVIDNIVADWLGAVDELILVGHADRSGSERYNQRLSERRTAAVTEALVSQGLAANRIRGSAVGESDPLVATADGVREARNRRVVVTINGR